MRIKLLVTTLIIVLLMAYYLLGTGYVEQRQEQVMLASRIADARQLLEQIPKPPKNLEQRLAAAKTERREVNDSFPTKLNSTQVINHILKSAERYKITAIPLATKAWSDEVVGEHGYHVFRLNIAVKGSYYRLVSFVSGLERGEYQTLVVEDLTVIRITEQPQDGHVDEDTEIVTASLKLAVYTRSTISN